GTDYEITYPAGMTNAGTYTVNVDLKGNYSGSGAAAYTIAKASQKVTAVLSAETIAVGKTATVIVTGSQGKVTYKSDDTSVAEVSEDGTISANKVGTAVISVISAATTNYKKKTVKLTVSVVPGATTKIAVANKSNGIKVAWKAVAGATGYYIYRNNKLAKTITSGTTTSWGDTKATTNCAKYTYKVVAYADTGKSTVSKSLTTYWLTRPAISSLTNSAAGKLTVKWDKNSKATGYQVQVSTSSKFTSGTTKTATIRNIATVSKVVGSLKKGTTYYVRVRSFLTKDGKNYYSMWSAVKNLKLTK
ncbi:MAG: fibronectin type III domain-containing protein, partial [Solobacterium sp.]|nr:fibronectin type III domain-containing protein [Solobacterium sp.]